MVMVGPPRENVPQGDGLGEEELDRTTALRSSFPPTRIRSQDGHHHPVCSGDQGERHHILPSHCWAIMAECILGQAGIRYWKHVVHSQWPEALIPTRPNLMSTANYPRAGLALLRPGEFSLDDRQRHGCGKSRWRIRHSARDQRAAGGSAHSVGMGIAQGHQAVQTGDLRDSRGEPGPRVPGRQGNLRDGVRHDSHLLPVFPAARRTRSGSCSASRSSLESPQELIAERSTA